MKPLSEPTADLSAMSRLLATCRNLCEGADSTLARLDPGNEAYLARNLEDTLQQLELILRALGEVRPIAPPEAERQGLLKRLFQRGDGDSENKTDARPIEPPRFDVAQQGLQGNSWTVSMSELVSFLAFGRKTGVLWVDSPEEDFLIGMVDGAVMHATSNRTPEGLRLGEVLVGMGFLTRRQLERFLAQQPVEESNISGEALVEAGIISDEELRSALAHQMQQLFHRLIHTRNAVFRFREGMQVELAFQVKLDVNQLLIETARLEDELSSSAERATYAKDSWKSWQDELSSDLESDAAQDEATPAATECEPESEGQATEPEASPTDESASAEQTTEDADSGGGANESKHRHDKHRSSRGKHGGGSKQR